MSLRKAAGAFITAARESGVTHVALSGLLTLAIDAIELRKPKPVPVLPTGGFFPAQYAGMTAREAYYAYPRAREAPCPPW